MSSNVPLLAEDLTIIAASASFCSAFEIDPASVPGAKLDDLGAGEWAMPKLRSLLMATASGSTNILAYEVDLKRPGNRTRQLLVNAQRHQSSASSSSPRRPAWPLRRRLPAPLSARPA